LTNLDEKYMKEAVRLARKGMGRTSPNPMVGAVIVRNGRIIASGFHKKAGADHAEVDALKKISTKAVSDDVLYVTLEPCHHYGRTPPCTEAILNSGLKKVVIGMRDPNPKVLGGGAAYLQKKGVHVSIGVLESECSRLNEAYIQFVKTGRPFVLAKSALTMDGWTATSSGHSKWITNEQSRTFVHRLRDRVDGILVGVGTIMADDPLLTPRLKNRSGRDPVRVVLDTHLRMPLKAKVLNHSSNADTLVMVGEGVSPDLCRRIEKKGVLAIICPTKQGRVDLPAMLDLLGKLSITSLLVEGGSTVMGSFIRERLINKFHIVMAPKILGGGDGIPMARGLGPSDIGQALPLKDISVKRFGDDFLFTGYPVYKT
jgi:diaminohydroxyphosphoribosylaminopyrimidine deaminase/5-amino-6-(5-phosphoribosylamino)uracil reductase